MTGPLEDPLRTNAIELPPFGKYKAVLIGDSSHDTPEFYTARAKITEHLIQHHDFNIVALEADWPDVEAIDRHVHHCAGPRSTIEVTESEPAFQRFPRWMWRNHEHDRGLRKGQKAGIYGLDLYNMGASVRTVINYLDHVDPKMGMVARKRYGELERWVKHPQEYSFGSLLGAFKDCRTDVISVLKELLRNSIEYSSHIEDKDEFRSSEQNARLIKDAEEYYTALYFSSTESWKLRDSHKFEIQRVLDQEGKGAKAVVWAHNSRAGDARASYIGWHHKELNLGQLARESFGSQVVNLGSGTPMRGLLPDSYEVLAHQTGIKSFFLVLRDSKCDENLREQLMKKRLERFIGFDGCIWFDETKAIQALEAYQPKTPLENDETYPFGM
ncbi:hypothetical protein N431DRAFT_509811 [Stipitochalara longipes BDJ]|nr:hypothetical protein N431DRAFT_509811 [Stipitochalara longipes BDJ]